MATRDQADPVAQMIGRIAVLYQRPKQIGTEAEGRAYLGELDASIRRAGASGAVLAEGWERLKATWQFGWWPTPKAVLDAIADAQRDANELADREQAAIPAISFKRRSVEALVTEIMRSPIGQDMLRADLGWSLLGMIEVGRVTCAADVTDKVLLACQQSNRAFLKTLERCERDIADNGLMATCVNVGRRMLDRNEALKARYLANYVPRSAGSVDQPRKQARAIGDWTKRARWVRRPQPLAPEEGAAPEPAHDVQRQSDGEGMHARPDQPSAPSE